MKSTVLSKKSNLSKVQNDGDKSYYLYKNNITVYPIYKNGKFQIQVNNNNRLKTFEKQISQKEINESIAKTINYYYELLQNEELKLKQK